MRKKKMKWGDTQKPTVEKMRGEGGIRTRATPLKNNVMNDKRAQHKGG